jgi:hypothetical protein
MAPSTIFGCPEAANQMNDLTPNDLSHLSEAEFQALPALQQPTTTLAAFSIGPACDLAKLDNEFRAWVRTPWRSDEIVTPTADA